MTAIQRVRRVQQVLRAITVGTVLFWAGTALFGGLALAAVINAWLLPPAVVEVALPIVAILGSLVTLGILAWRGRFVWSFDRVALWIEEHAPELRYALVTVIDPRYRETAGPLFDPIVAKVDTAPFVRTAATHTVLPAAVALLITVTVFMSLPKDWTETIRRGLPVIGGPSAPAVVGNRLTPLTGRLTPPSYAGLRETALDEPSTITGLQGSKVVLTGRGEPEGIVITLGRGDDGTSRVLRIPVTEGSRGWTASFTMSDSLPAALTMVDRQYRRLIVVDPRVDQPPAARLLVPVRDTTLREIRGTLELSAEFNDDIGLARAQFEYIVANTGEGDFAEARVGTLGTRTLRGKGGSFSMRVPFASLNLKEGDLLALTAIIYDNNTLYGPGKGYSETRTIRIARQGEYDTIAVNPAPPSVDTAMQTLRMLIIATTKLDSLKPEWARNKFVDSSQKLGGVGQGILRKIEQIIAEQTGGGEIAAAPLLLVARDAMWEANRSLFIAETGEAIPQLWIAYKALEKMRNEARYYLRGRMPPVIVNIARVRLSGGTDSSEAPKAAAREEARAVTGVDKERLRAQYAQAIRILREQPAQAVELFTLMRVMTLRPYPAIAAALGDAVTAIQGGTDATLPLLRARQALDGSAAALDTLPVWSGLW